jgi:WD40 repeat protein
LAVASADSTVAVWDWRTPGRPPIHLRGHQNPINAVAFDHSSRHLASASDDRTVRVWDWRAPHTPSTVLRNKEAASAVAFDRDGRHLASASVDGTVRVWDWRAPRVPATVLHVGHEYVDTLGFTGNHQRLTAVRSDGAAWVWDCQRCGNIEQVLKLASARTPREIHR